MGRQHPDFCEHGNCVNPGDESFGLEYEPCNECLDEPNNRIAELEAENQNVKKLLELATCPQCDGSGAVPDGYDGCYQCQWCYEREQALQEGSE